MSTRMTPLRVNVLILMMAGFATVWIVFFTLVWGADKIDAAEAYNIIEGPLMALIGGALAISKDLIPFKTKDEENGSQARMGETSDSGA